VHKGPAPSWNPGHTATAYLGVPFWSCPAQRRQREPYAKQRRPTGGVSVANMAEYPKIKKGKKRLEVHRPDFLGALISVDSAFIVQAHRLLTPLLVALQGYGVDVDVDDQCIAVSALRTLTAPVPWDATCE
jgi:hypothetical protein